MQVNYTSPAVLGEGFAQGVKMAQNSENMAIRREEAARARAKYEDDMQFIPLDKIAQGIPNDMQQGMMQIAESGGYITEINGVKGAHKHKLGEFMKDFSSNKLWQAMALQSSLDMIDKAMEEGKGQLEQLGQVVKKDLAEYQWQIQKLHKDAKAENRPVEMSKVRAYEDKIKKYQAENPAYAQLQELSKQMEQLVQLRSQRATSFGMIDDGYKKDVEKFGKEKALMIAMGKLDRRQLILQQKAEEAKIISDRQIRVAKAKSKQKAEEAKIIGDRQIRVAKAKSKMKDGGASGFTPLPNTTKDFLKKFD